MSLGQSVAVPTQIRSQAHPQYYYNTIKTHIGAALARQFRI